MTISAVQLDHLGAFFGGISALITVLWGIALWVVNKVSKERTVEMVAATTAGVQEFLAKRIAECINDMDPSSFYTLDLNFENDLSLVVPMLPHRPITVLENIQISVINHSRDATLLLLSCPGFGHIRPHFHLHTCETIEVREGTITHLETGRIYRPGDVWSIPASEMHSATFSNVVAIVIHRPTLPTAAERPVNLDNMSRIFAH